MSDNADHVVLTLQRGERGELRLSRSKFEGHTFTKLHLWYPSDNGELKPGRQVLTIRDHELGDVIDSLRKIARKVDQGGHPGGNGGSANTTTDQPPRTDAQGHVFGAQPGTEASAEDRAITENYF